MTTEEIKNIYAEAEKIVKEENFTRELKDNEGNICQGLLIGIVTVPQLTTDDGSNSAKFIPDEDQNDENSVRVINKSKEVVNFCAFVRENDYQSPENENQNPDTSKIAENPPSDKKSKIVEADKNEESSENVEKSCKIETVISNGIDEGSDSTEHSEYTKTSVIVETSKITEKPESSQISEDQEKQKSAEVCATDESLKSAETMKTDITAKIDEADKMDETSESDEISKSDSKNCSKLENENKSEEVQHEKNLQNTNKPQTNENVKNEKCSNEQSDTEKDLNGEKMEIEVKETTHTSKHWEKSKGWILKTNIESQKNATMVQESQGVVCPIPKECSKLWIFPNNATENGKCCEKGVSYAWDGENWETLKMEESNKLSEKNSSAEDVEEISKSAEEEKMETNK